MDFNASKDTYRATINETVAFTGKNHAFFTGIKAHYLRKIVEGELAEVDHPRVLDVGCGHGYIHTDLRPFGYRIVAVEVAEQVLRLARETNPGVTYICSEAENLPFADDTFDVVIAICLFHHVPPRRWSQLARQMRRVVRAGGIAVIFEHNPMNPLTRYVVANNDIDADAVLLSERATRGLLWEAGFAEVRSRSILFTPFAGSVFRALDEALGVLPFGAQYYAVGKAS
jgi:SAM-dependent methyltransferase